ncbi:MAG: glutaredoxin family protein [Actinobacteria bacterium ATB1]|nr:glutaredoxin family protein [Actinobacteria bacterium ATB1]
MFRRKRPSVRLTLYGKPGCHLCDLADEAVGRTSRRIPLEVDHVDITGDPRLEELFGSRIPVVTDESGEILCEGKVSETRLRASLRNHAQSR